MKDTATREKINAALSSVLWSLLLTGLKIWAGITTGSLGVLSEALHSGLDFIAAAITFYAVKIASRPADESHPYGHGKVENLSALVETVLLVLTCGWILWEALERLFVKHVDVDLSIWAFLVVIISLLVDINRSAMLRRVAKKHRSQALEADALHFTTDIWSSGVVLLGLIGVWLARFTEPGSQLEIILKKADSVAALGVAIVILFVAWGLCKRAIHALMDGGSKELNEAVRRALREKAPWYPIRKMRIREVGATAYAELDVAVTRDFHVDAAHEVAEQIREIVCQVLPNGQEAEVTVHVDPQKTEDNTPPETIAQYIALRHHVLVHGYLEVSTQEGLLVFMDVEMPPDWPLDKAHELLAALESDLKKNLGVSLVALRIEPDKRDLRPPQDAPSMTPDEITDLIEKHCLASKEIFLKSIDVEDIDGAPLIFLKGEVIANHTVLTAHELSEKLIWEIKQLIPCAAKIIPLLEPSKTNSSQE